MAVAGVAALATPHRETSAASDQAFPQPRSPAEVREAAAEVYGSFAGSEHQQDAGLLLKAYTLNHAVDDCLANAGYPDWDWSLSRQYAIPTDPLDAGVWFAEPNRPFRSDVLIAEKPRLEADSTMNRDDIDPASKRRFWTASIRRRLRPMTTLMPRPSPRS
jgi:hypothetical protein